MIVDDYVEEIKIIDTYWKHVEISDDVFSRLRKAVNEANSVCDVTTFYTIDESGKNVDLHSKFVIFFCAQIPATLVDYLCIELDKFFHAHQCFRLEMAKQKETEV